MSGRPAVRALQAVPTGHPPGVARGSPASIQTISLGELLAHPFPARDHLLEPWLRQGESVMLYAATGLGKTMLALSLAVAVAGGGDLLGWRAEKPRSVLYVDGEMHIVDLRDRLAMLSETVAGCDLEAAHRNLRVLSRQHQGPAVAFPDLSGTEGQDVVLAEAARIGAELVVLDNFSTLAEVADENDASAMSPVLSFLLRMKQADRACILVHHSGKQGTSYRGSSKLATTFEVILGLHRLDGRTAIDGAGFELRWEKFRGKPTAATRDASVILSETSEGPRWTSSAAPDAELLLLVDTVASGEHATQREVAAALGWDASKVTRMKAEAIRKGLTTRAEWDGCLAAAREAHTGTPPDF